MQNLGAVTYDDLKAPVQELLYKFEVYDGAAWINLCALGGLNYLIKDSLSFSSGGAGVSPDPIAGTWSAEISNDDGIFHPRHPYSVYSSLLQCGRKVRISVGAVYGGTDYFWPRLVGYMDAPHFDNTNRRVSLSGGDSMKALADTRLASPDNFWGSSATYSTIASVMVLGSEMYNEADALEIEHDTNNVTNWVVADGTFESSTDGGGGSTYVGLLQPIDDTDAPVAYNDNVGNFSAGVTYVVSFKYKRTSPWTPGTKLSCYIYESGTYTCWGSVANLSSATWAAASFQFVCPKTTTARMTFKMSAQYKAGAVDIQVDQISIKPQTGDAINAGYELPAGANGPHYATLDGVPVSFGTTNDEWIYDEATNLVTFSEKKIIAAGTNNLVVYYFTTQDIIDVLGDVLSSSGLYVDRAAALAALSYTDPDIDIQKVWFETGTPALAATAKICERCGYRFWFDELDVPHFQPAPTHGDPVAWFSSRTAADGGDFQDIEEVRNSIVIEGIERGAFSTAKDKKTSRITGLANDGPFSADKLEQTYSTTNDLFQDQPTVDAMAATLLAAFKDPKLYSDLPVPKNPIPLERGDTVEWDIELRPAIGSDPGLKNTVRGIIRDASFSGDGFNYKCEMRSQAMNIANYATGPVTVTAEHCKGWALTNAGASGDVQFNLPAAVVGMEITFYVMAAQTLTINPNGTERIAVLTGTNGDYLRSDAVIGSCIKLTCLVAGYWHKVGVAVGTWTEE